MIDRRVCLEVELVNGVLVKKTLKDPNNELVWPQLRGIGLVHGSKGLGDTELLKFFLVGYESSFLGQVRELSLEPFQLLGNEIEDFSGRKSVHATYDLPVARDVVLLDKIPQECIRLKLKACYVRFRGIDDGLAMSSVLCRVGKSVDLHLIRSSQTYPPCGSPARLSRLKHYNPPPAPDKLSRCKSPRDTTPHNDNICRGRYVCRGAMSKKFLRWLVVPVRLGALHARELGLSVSQRGDSHGVGGMNGLCCFVVGSAPILSSSS